MRFSTYFMCCAACLSFPTFAQSQVQPVDGYAAVVNGKIITVGDVVERIRPALLQLRRQSRDRDFDEKQAEIFNQGLEKLIEQKLMVSQFEKLGAELPVTAVRERTDTILRERFGNDRSQLQQTLRMAGKTVDQWENEIREQLISQSMTQQFVTSKLHISPREIREAYETHKQDLQTDVELKLRSIAFRPAASGDEEARQSKIQEAMKRLAEGDRFADVAVAYSEGPIAARGGDEGWVTLSGLQEPLSTKLGEVEVGDVTPLIDTPTQSFIFKVEDRRGGEIPPLADVQYLLERRIRNEKFEERYESWIDGMRNDFQIQRFNPDISAITGVTE
ncbi:MAG: peptidyl-prolyl cis-trans isomerase [Kiritimatiellae bacterium]|nr:peptidyl-prolyl cis-trans isomerase [Kiritimatiellia bacterium]